MVIKAQNDAENSGNNQLFVSYRKHGGLKASALPDFYIGAHAAVPVSQLLS